MAPRMATLRPLSPTHPLESTRTARNTMVESRAAANEEVKRSGTGR